MIKVFEMFAGYGGGSFALKNIGIEHQVVGFSEIDKYAIQCYEQNHKGKNFGDCRKINPSDLPDFDLLTGGTPCQDFSIAGKGKGIFNKDGTITRSGLLFEYVRILKVKKPKYFLWENVKGILTKPHEKSFIMFIGLLINAGYDVDFRLFNSKDYGIPQNRERVFIYGIRKDLNTLQVSG